MVEIAERMREKRKGLGIIRGERLGQVGSETVERMYGINGVR